MPPTSLQSLCHVISSTTNTAMLLTLQAETTSVIQRKVFQILCGKFILDKVIRIITNNNMGNARNVSTILVFRFSSVHKLFLSIIYHRMECDVSCSYEECYTLWLPCQQLGWICGMCKVKARPVAKVNESKTIKNFADSRIVFFQYILIWIHDTHYFIKWIQRF